jgi:hypothetical protein
MRSICAFIEERLEESQRLWREAREGSEPLKGARYAHIIGMLEGTLGAVSSELRASIENQKAEGRP